MAELAYKWYNDGPVLRKFLQAAINSELITEIEEVSEFLKKPSTYNEQETVWENNDSPVEEGDEGWEEFVDDLNEGEDEEEEEEEETE